MSFTHIDENGNAVMVNVGDKQETKRRAAAGGRIRMSRECFEALSTGAVKKGDVLTVAQVAGIMAAKKTHELIPLCHNLLLSDCKVEFRLDDEQAAVEVRCQTACLGQTGVEMEALTGASVALLTVYDMCKAMDREMVIDQVKLIEKEGGRSGHYIAAKKESDH